MYHIRTTHFTTLFSPLYCTGVRYIERYSSIVTSGIANTTEHHLYDMGYSLSDIVVEQNRTEQNRTEQNRTEQNRTEWYYRTTKEVLQKQYDAYCIVTN